MFPSRLYVTVSVKSSSFDFVSLTEEMGVDCLVWHLKDGMTSGLDCCSQSLNIA